MSYKGWHSRGYLPHFNSAETVQFVTIRLADSLPGAFTGELSDLPEDLAEADQRLDDGLGACWLKQPTLAQLVEDTIMHFDARRYCLLAWCIMPNHVHVVVVPIDGNRIGAIVHSWKSFSAKQANRILGRSGAFWHRDHFDWSIRDEPHLMRTIEYVESNPVKAGLAGSAAAWPWSSGRLRI